MLSGISIMFSGGIESTNYVGNIIILGVPIAFAFQLTILNYNSHIDFMPATFFAMVQMRVLFLCQKLYSKKLGKI